MNLFQGLQLLKTVLPENSLSFAVQLLLTSGVRSVVFRHGEEAWAMKLREAPGACDLETKTIDLDIDMDIKHLASVISRCHGISIEPQETPLWILCHEIAHVIFGSSQEKAEDFAKGKFVEWKKAVHGRK